MSNDIPIKLDNSDNIKELFENVTVIDHGDNIILFEHIKYAQIDKDTNTVTCEIFGREGEFQLVVETALLIPKPKL